MFFNKKYKEKIRQELKKEILAELKKEQNKENTAQEKKSEIPRKVTNSKEDLEEIRQKLFPAVIFVTGVMVLLVILLLYDGNLNLIKKQNKVEPISKPKDVIYWKLSEFEGGEIPLDNDEMFKLIKEIEFKTNDYTLFDTKSFFEKLEIKVSDMSIEQQMYLMGKTQKFNNYINSLNLSTVQMICYEDGAITIESGRIENIMKSELNIEKVEHQSFGFEYFAGNNLVTYIHFEYVDGVYRSKCISEEAQEDIKQDIQTLNRVIAATKKKDIIEIDVKVAFKTEAGVYMDYLLENKIENTNNIVNVDYVLDGSDYKYIYKPNETGDYYLYSIQNVTQAQ